MAASYEELSVVCNRLVEDNRQLADKIAVVTEWNKMLREQIVIYIDLLQRSLVAWSDPQFVQTASGWLVSDCASKLFLWEDGLWHTTCNPKSGQGYFATEGEARLTAGQSQTTAGHNISQFTKVCEELKLEPLVKDVRLIPRSEALKESLRLVEWVKSGYVKAALPGILVRLIAVIDSLVPGTESSIPVAAPEDDLLKDGPKFVQNG